MYLISGNLLGIYICWVLGTALGQGGSQMDIGLHKKSKTQWWTVSAKAGWHNGIQEGSQRREMWAVLEHNLSLGRRANMEEAGNSLPGFMDAVRKYETAGSETKDYYSQHSKQHELHSHAIFFDPQITWKWQLPSRWVLCTVRTPELMKYQSFITGCITFTLLNRKQISALLFIFHGSALHKQPCKRSFRTKGGHCLHFQDMQEHVTWRVKGGGNSHLRWQIKKNWIY